ncbi:hypothetical protein JXL21_08405 [Candidatus Bathyarchaeota archaeon]|nr:hypothetical protein [Candidatus Bathyarchaeota archaeon]
MLREATLSLLEKHSIKIDPTLDEQQLVSEEAISSLIEASGVTGEEVALEVGPGLGNITEQLLRAARSVVGVEKNPKYIPVLRDRFKRFDNLNVVLGDALQMELPRFDRLVSNLPYMIAEAFLQRTLRLEMKSAAFIVSKGFADIVTAEEDAPHYSKLSYLAQLFYEVKERMAVLPSAYYPEPSTETSIVTLTPRRDGPTKDQVLRDLFRQSDKLTRNALREALINTGVADTKRQSRGIIEELDLLEDTLFKRVARLSLTEVTKLDSELSNMAVSRGAE